MYPLLAVAAVVGLWLLTRTMELFRLSARDGRVLVVRGRVPPRLLADIRSVVAAAGVARGTIRALKHEGGARLVCSSEFDADTAQRLRNVFGLVPIARLRHAPAIARPTLGQLLGVAWLAWLLEHRG